MYIFKCLKMHEYIKFTKNSYVKIKINEINFMKIIKFMKM